MQCGLARRALDDRRLVLSQCREYLKLGKPANVGAFGETYDRLVAQEILGDEG